MKKSVKDAMTIIFNLLSLKNESSSRSSYFCISLSLNLLNESLKNDND